MKPPNRITVNVNQLDIDRGRPGNASMCPIAQSLERRGYVHVAVGPNHLQICMACNHMGGGEAIYKTSPHAANFIRDFDNGKPVNPSRFTFYLEPAGVEPASGTEEIPYSG